MANEIEIATAEDLVSFLGTFLDRPEWTGTFNLSTPAEGQRAAFLDLTNGDEHIQLQVGGMVKPPVVGVPATVVPVDGGASYLQYSQSQWTAIQAVLNNQ